MSKTVKNPLPALGVDLLSNETALISGTVREAVNVDIGRAGVYKRRAGQTLRVSGNDFHSIWLSQQRNIIFVGKGNKINQFDPTDHSLVELGTLNSGDPVSYTEYNGNVYWTNKSTLQWLPADAVSIRAVGVPVPEYNPSLVPATGNLLPGKYGVRITYIDDRGEEGGATDLQIIDLPGGGGIALNGLPTMHPSWQIRVYTTEPNSSRLRITATFPAVFPMYTISTSADGSDCDTIGMKPMPSGEFITWLAGRLYIARGNTLYFSEAGRPHLHTPAHNYIQFSGLITFIESVSDGIYVGDSRGVWFLSGNDPVKFEQILVNINRAIRRSGVKIPAGNLPEKKVPSPNPVAVWLSTVGYVAGMDGGVTVELQPERVKVPAGLIGRTVYLFRDGIKQVITPVNSTSTVAFGTAVDSVIS